MNALLSLYSRRVMRGEWRDYAIDQRDGMARFAVFRSSFERPLLVITKQHKGLPKPGALAPATFNYTVQAGRETLAQGTSLTEVLEVADRLVKASFRVRGTS